jgi:thymidylate synthase (FAD)
MLREKQHVAMIEHGRLIVLFTCDRGISHEIVRHRMASYAQESTRYCNYSKDKFGKEITIIDPFATDDSINQESFDTWLKACEVAEHNYFKMLDQGQSPQIARAVLPNALKTEIVVNCNFREWLHIFKLRTAPSAHPAIRKLMMPLYEYLNNHLPEIFTL